jgi:3-oxoacyl-[acyl-carrier-protein] synthase-3
MAKFHFNNIFIDGIACAVPAQKMVVTSFYESFGKKVVDDFIKMTGISEAYRAIEEQTTSDLCFVAAEKLLEANGIDRNKIDAIVFVSQSPDYRLPATACVLHYRLDLKKDCLAFDVGLGCSGYVYGIQTLSSLLQNSDMEYGLLMVGDTASKQNSPQDKSLYMMFGDAGTATILRRASGADYFDAELMTNGKGFKNIVIPSGAYRNRNGSFERTMWGDGNTRSDYDGVMNGTDVFSFSIREAPSIINSFMAEHSKTYDDYEALVLHQANLYMLKQIANKCKCPMEKVPITLDRYGNTSSATIPITLADHFHKGYVKQEIEVLASAFGVGLSWGVMNMRLDTDRILPIIHTDDYFTEGGVSHD